MAGTRPLSIDAALETVGQWGPWQWRHYATVTLAWIPCALITLSTVFANNHPLWRAEPTDGAPNPLPSADPAPCDAPIELIDPWRSIQAEWNLTCEREWLSGLVDSLYFLGFGLGTTFIGKWSDRH